MNFSSVSIKDKKLFKKKLTLANSTNYTNDEDSKGSQYKMNKAFSQNLILNESIKPDIFNTQVISEFGESPELLEHYERLEILGNGANGKVYKVRHRANGQYYAAKVLIIYEDEDRLHISNEYKILSQLESDLIIKVKEMF